MAAAGLLGPDLVFVVLALKGAKWEIPATDQKSSRKLANTEQQSLSKIPEFISRKDLLAQQGEICVPSFLRPCPRVRLRAIIRVWETERRSLTATRSALCMVIGSGSFLKLSRK